MSDITGKVQGDTHKNTRVLGGYYRRPVEGDVVMTYGVGPGFVMFRTEDGEGTSGSRETMDAWELLEGARDFPNAKDPRLPSEFDLHYDTHTLSQLAQEFDGLDNAVNDPSVAALCRTYGVDLRDPQTLRDYNEKQRK